MTCLNYLGKEGGGGENGEDRFPPDSQISEFIYSTQCFSISYEDSPAFEM